MCPIGRDRAIKSAAEKTPFTRSTGEHDLFLNSLSILARVWGSAFYITDQQIDSNLQLATTREAFSSVFIFIFFFVFRAGWRYSLVTWPRTLGRSPLLLSSLLVKVLEVSIPESLVALSWLPCRSASQDHSSSWGPPTLVPPSKRTVFFPLLSVNLMDTPHTHRDTRTIGDWCLCVCVCLVVSRRADFAIRSDRVIELDVWSDTIDNTVREYDIGLRFDSKRSFVV